MFLKVEFCIVSNSVNFPNKFFVPSSPVASWSGLVAVLYAAAFASLLSVMWVLVRKLSTNIHPLEITFWGNIFGLLTLLPTVIRNGRSVFRTDRIGLHFVRAIFNGSAILAWFCALPLVPLADATALNLFAPLLITLGAIFFFKERVGPRRWMALGFGGLGALVLVRPGFQELDLGLTLVWATNLFSAVQRLISKSLVKTDTSITSVVYLMLFMVPVTFIPSIFVWTQPTLIEFGILALIGMLLATAHFAWMKALTLADISALEPVNFIRLVWGALFGFAFFAEVPTVWTWVGGLMIIASTTYIARREAALRTDKFSVPTA